MGAGLAGLRTARDLADAGHPALVLEARARVGGRGYSARLGDRLVELGGSWFTPDHVEARKELERYGLGVREYRPPRSARWLTGGELRFGLPVPWSEIGALEQALARVLANAELVASGDEELGSLSAADYVDSFEPSEALRDFLLGWWQLMGGAPPQRGAVADALASVRTHGGLGGLVGCLAYGPEDGWSALAEALAAASEMEVRLGRTVVEIEHSDEGVVVAVADGERFECEAVVLAVPLNCLPGITFNPPLPTRAAEAAGANAGAAVKVLMLATGIEAHGIAVGLGPGLNWLYADEERDGAVHVIGFGWEDERFDMSRREVVERALKAFYPEGDLVDWANHDWIGDPTARGTWLTAPAGRLDLVDPSRLTPVGRVFFAGSDVALDEAGWFEGALRSGAATAEAVALLDRARLFD